MKYKWLSKTTGEICPNLWQVMKAVWSNLKDYHFADFKWQYNKQGW